MVCGGFRTEIAPFRDELRVLRLVVQKRTENSGCSYAGQEMTVKSACRVPRPTIRVLRPQRMIAHDVFIGECIGCDSRLCFLHALCIGFRRRRNEDRLCLDGRVWGDFGAGAGGAFESVAGGIWRGDFCYSRSGAAGRRSGGAAGQFVSRRGLRWSCGSGASRVRRKNSRASCLGISGIEGSGLHRSRSRVGSDGRRTSDCAVSGYGFVCSRAEHGGRNGTRGWLRFADWGRR